MRYGAPRQTDCFHQRTFAPRWFGPLKRIGSLSVKALDNGQLIRLSYPPYDVLVAWLDGRPVAIEDACNHAGASLVEGDRVRDDRCVSCPLHGYVFDLCTGKLIAPVGACADQRIFDARIEGDEVVVYDPFFLTIR